MSSRFINIIRKSDIINDISYNYDLNLLIDYLLGKSNSNPPPYKQTEDSEYKCILRKYENVISFHSSLEWLLRDMPMTKAAVFLGMLRQNC